MNMVGERSPRESFVKVLSEVHFGKNQNDLLEASKVSEDEFPLLLGKSRSKRRDAADMELGDFAAPRGRDGHRPFKPSGCRVRVCQVRFPASVLDLFVFEFLLPNCQPRLSRLDMTGTELGDFAAPRGCGGH
jgi:hypothetical protein